MPYAFNNPAFRLGGVMGGGTIIPTSTFVSAEIGAVDSATVVVTYSGAAPSVSSGHVVKVNSASVTIASHSISGSTVRLTLADAADALDTLLVSCSSGSGNIIAHTDSAVTNNAVSMASFGSLKVAFTARRPEYLGETAEVSPIDPVEDGDRIYMRSARGGLAITLFKLRLPISPYTRPTGGLSSTRIPRLTAW